jgi:hypothetical protein
LPARVTPEAPRSPPRAPIDPALSWLAPLPVPRWWRHPPVNDGWEGRSISAARIFAWSDNSLGATLIWACAGAEAARPDMAARWCDSVEDAGEAHAGPIWACSRLTPGGSLACSTSDDRELLLFGFPTARILLGLQAGGVGATCATLNIGCCPRAPTHTKMMIYQMRVPGSG